MDDYSANILIVGVGGQGILLAGRLIGETAMRAGYDVKVSEVHGMAQRGGSVNTFVKIGKKVYSPLIEPGNADIILAFEQLESLRWIDYLCADGTVIINEQKIDPMPVITGISKYPGNIIGMIKPRARNCVHINALDIARECGNIKVVNMVLIGVLAGVMPIRVETWLDSIKSIVPSKMLDVNIQAFKKGHGILASEGR